MPYQDWLRNCQASHGWYISLGAISDDLVWEMARLGVVFNLNSITLLAEKVANNSFIIILCVISIILGEIFEAVISISRIFTASGYVEWESVARCPGPLYPGRNSLNPKLFRTKTPNSLSRADPFCLGFWPPGKARCECSTGRIALLNAIILITRTTLLTLFFN